MKVAELKEALKELKKTHKEIKITGKKKAELEELYNKYKTRRQKLEEDIAEIQSKKMKKAESKGVPVETFIKEARQRKKEKKAKAEEEAKAVVHNTFTNAEQVFFNPDLLRLIGGFKKDLEIGETVSNIIRREGAFWDEGSDDLNSVHPDTFTDELVKNLKAKQNPAVSEYVGSASHYGGNGSHMGILAELLDTVLTSEEIFFGMVDDITVSVEDSNLDVEDMNEYFDEYITVMRHQSEYSEDEIEELEERRDDGEELDDSEDDAIKDWRDPLSSFSYGPEVFRMKISYKTDAERLRLIEVLKVFKEQLKVDMRW